MLDKYKPHFTETRWNELCELVKEKGMKISWKDFTTSELLVIIDETPLSEKVREGAIDYYIKHIKQKDIAAKFSYSEDNIKYYAKKVKHALKVTCNRLFK